MSSASKINYNCYSRKEILAEIKENSLNMDLPKIKATKVQIFIKDESELDIFNINNYIDLNFFENFFTSPKFEDFAELFAFIGFFGLVLTVIYCVVGELTWISQFFNNRMLFFFKKNIEKNASIKLENIVDNKKSKKNYLSFFFWFFY